jgi:hypothetical protein
MVRKLCNAEASLPLFQNTILLSQGNTQIEAFSHFFTPLVTKYVNLEN